MNYGETPLNGARKNREQEKLFVGNSMAIAVTSDILDCQVLAIAEITLKVLKILISGERFLSIFIIYFFIRPF